MEHTPSKAITVKEIAEMGLAVALAVALSYVSKLIPLPFIKYGGTIALGIIPVFYIALRRGFRDALIAGLALGLVTMITDPYFVHPVQILLDYPLPGMALALAGLPPFRGGEALVAGHLCGRRCAIRLPRHLWPRVLCLLRIAVEHGSVDLLPGVQRELHGPQHHHSAGRSGCPATRARLVERHQRVGYQTVFS
jgi:hypothetical protein